MWRSTREDPFAFSFVRGSVSSTRRISGLSKTRYRKEFCQGVLSAITNAQQQSPPRSRMCYPFRPPAIRSSLRTRTTQAMPNITQDQSYSLEATPLQAFASVLVFARCVCCMADTCGCLPDMDVSAPFSFGIPQIRSRYSSLITPRCSKSQAHVRQRCEQLHRITELGCEFHPVQFTLQL